MRGQRAFFHYALNVIAANILHTKIALILTVIFVCGVEMGLISAIATIGDATRHVEFCGVAASTSAADAVGLKIMSAIQDTNG